MLNNLRDSRLPQLLCAFPQAQYFSLGFLAKFFVPFLSQYCLFALVFFSSQIAEVVTEPIPRASDSREREEGLSNLLPLLHRPQSTLHRCSRPQPPDLTTAQRNGRAKENGNNGNSGNPEGLVADRGEPSAFFLCGLLVSYVCGGDLPSLTAIVRSLLLRYFFASLVVPYFAIPFFRCFLLGCSVASPFRPLLCPCSDCSLAPFQVPLLLTLVSSLFPYFIALLQVAAFFV